jgi:hypothetical protein
LTVKGISAARTEPVNFLGMKAPKINLRRNMKAIPRRGLAFSENWQ